MFVYTHVPAQNYHRLLPVRYLPTFDRTLTPSRTGVHHLAYEHGSKRAENDLNSSCNGRNSDGFMQGIETSVPPPSIGMPRQPQTSSGKVMESNNDTLKAPPRLLASVGNNNSNNNNNNTNAGNNGGNHAVVGEELRAKNAAQKPQQQVQQTLFAQRGMQVSLL